MSIGNNKRRIPVRRIAMTMVAIIATSSALVPVSAQAGLLTHTPEEGVVMSRKGGMIVRNIWSDKPLGTCGTTMCDKPEDVFAGLCLNDGYRKASIEEKKRIHAVLSRTTDYMVVMKVGMFLTDRAGVLAKRGTVAVGDEVTYNSVPLVKALPDIAGLNCVSPNKTVYVVDRVLKHHDGTILYSNGKVFGGAPSNEKPASKPAPKPSSFLD